MRRSRRGGHGGPEFGGSGEDSFVAVVVTKLTGALLFILLLTMVIMALIPKADEARRSSTPGSDEPPPLAIATPEALPEAIAGRPYDLALAATGGRGPLRWAIDGPLPRGMAFDPETGHLRGTPRAGTPTPAELILRVTDGADRAAITARLVVYEPDRPLTVPSRWAPGLPPLPWRAWMDQGFGFLLLLLVQRLALNAVGRLERAAEGGGSVRFRVYRTVVWLASLAAAAGLAAWIGWPRGS
jgi:hypothetical protein